mgnify:CR=1 FL=1
MKTVTSKPGANDARGFSLLEMVIVLGIIGLILAAAAGLGGKMITVGKIKTTQARLLTLRAQLAAYQVLAGHYSTEWQGLLALAEKPRVTPVPGSANRGSSPAMPGKGSISTSFRARRNRR